MKALFVILILVGLVAAGCGDSTNDVLVAGGERSIDPDTVVTQDELVMEFYLAENARAIENEAVVAVHSGVQSVVDMLTQAGCVRDESGTTLIRVTDPDGRTLEATWLAFVDPSDPGALNGVVYAHTEERDYVVPLRVSDTGTTGGDADDWWSTAPGKEWGPSLSLKTMFGNCLAFAAGLLDVCIGTCIMEGAPANACQRSCNIVVAAAFVACIFYSIVD